MKKFRLDYYLLSLLFIMFLISSFSLYKADLINMNVDNILIKQILWYVVGCFLIILILYLKNDIFIKNALLIYIICNILLLLLLIFADPINGAKCWFKIKGIGTIQISEFTKIAIILMCSCYLTKIKYKNKLKQDLRLLFYSFIIFIIPAILTFLEPDTGAVLMYLIIVFFILFVLNLRLRWYICLISFILTIVLSSVFLYYFNTDLFLKIFGNDFFLRVERITYWFNKEGMQLSKGMTAIGMGGFLGLNTLVYFPEAHTDFIFATFASNTGFLGSIILITIITLFDLRLIHIANITKKKENKIIISGILAVLFYQQFQNIGMTFGILPITGITLPFISYGGSSLLSYMIMIGLVLNIYNESVKYKN